MKRTVLSIAAVFFFVATIAPITLQASGTAFWHGVNIDDTPIPYADMENIHWAIAGGMTDLVPGPTGFPTGDRIGFGPGERGVRIHVPDKTWDGYTLLNAFAVAAPWGTAPGAKTGNNVLIDMDGNIVNVWDWPGQAYNFASKVLPEGHIIGSLSGIVTQMDWDSNVVKEWPDTNMHHDIEKEGSPCGYFSQGQEPITFGGKVLVLENQIPDDDPSDGLITEDICSSKMILDDYIRELTWDGEELFRWDAWLHFDQFDFDEWAEAGMDKGYNYQGPDFMAPALPEDWSHGNAVAWVGPNKWWDKYRDYRFHPDNIIADFRSLNVTIIIARHDHPNGDWEEGDIVWQLGPDYSTAGENYKVGQIIGQHMAHMIPKYLPGAGNIMIFDNGGSAGYGALVQGLRTEPLVEGEMGAPLGTWPNTFRMFSRVLEINPMTKQIVWEYKQPKLSADLDEDGLVLGNEKLFFSNLMSGAQRLPNGNTLITEADIGRIFEVTRSGEVVWEYAPTWVPNIGGPMAAFVQGVYRAYRIPYWWIPKEFQEQHNKKKK
jgi:hypothetical protein